MREPKAIDTALYEPQLNEQRGANIVILLFSLTEPGYYNAEKGFGIRLETIMMAHYSNKPKVS